jgi:uncharacterized protein (DUF697 family)
MEDKEKTIIPPDLEPGTDKASFSHLRSKRNRALEIIGQHTLANMLLAGSPFPFSDAPFLAVSEGVMVARIMLVYDMERPLGALTGLFGSIGGTLISSMATLTAGNLAKCFPGTGTIIGGGVNAGVAAAFTIALGLATIGICEYTWIQAARGEVPDIADFLNKFDRELEDALRRAYNQSAKRPISPYQDHQDEWAY